MSFLNDLFEVFDSSWTLTKTSEFDRLIPNWKRQRGSNRIEVYSSDSGDYVIEEWRDNCFEFHHATKDLKSGIKINNNNPPVVFVSTMMKLIQSKVESGYCVRIFASRELIESYMKLAKALLVKRKFPCTITSISQYRNAFEFQIVPKQMFEGLLTSVEIHI